MKAYVINLPESVDERLSRIRRRHLESQLAVAKLPHEFVATVDGWRLTSEERARQLDEEVISQQSSWFKPGVVGASLSHVRAYRQILEAGDSAAVVLEDDVILDPTLPALLEHLSELLAKSEVVLLYWRTWSGCEFSARDARTLVGGSQLMFPMDPHKLAGAVAYVITGAACESMSRRLLPIRTGADAWGEFHEGGAFESLRCVVPRPVGMRTDFKSTLGYLEPLGLTGRLSAVVAHRRVFPIHQFLGLRRARLERQMSAYEVVGERSPLAASRGQ